MKNKVLIVILIGLLLLMGLVFAGCQKDECKGTCKWDSEYGLYGGCDMVHGGRCYDECAASKASINKPPLSVKCNCP